MSYIFNNGEFRGDFGAGLVRAVPFFIGAWVKYVNHPIAVRYALHYGEADAGTGNRASILTRNTADGALACGINDSSYSDLTLADPASLDNEWFTLCGRYQADNQRVFVDNVAGDGSAITLAGDMRYFNIGRRLATDAGLTTNEKVAHVIVLHFEPTSGERADYTAGINPLTIWAGRNDFFYYPLTTESTTQTDASGNGGPDLTAAGTVTFDGDDNPTITASGPAITTVTPSDLTAATNPTITGTLFGVTQGTGTVKISPTDNVADVNAVTQTINTWSDTSIVLTGVAFPTDTLNNATLYLFVTDDAAASNAAGAVVTADLPGMPVTEPLYFGGSLLTNRTNISWKVTTGHGNLTGTVLGSGAADGTTNGSGVFVFPAGDGFGAHGTAVTLYLYWTEGDPVADRSLIVKTTLAV